MWCKVEGYIIYMNAIKVMATCGWCVTETRLFLEKDQSIHRVKIAYSFFSGCVKSVSIYHFKPGYVVLHMTVKEFLGNHF